MDNATREILASYGASSVVVDRLESCWLVDGSKPTLNHQKEELDDKLQRIKSQWASADGDNVWPLGPPTHSTDEIDDP